MKIEFNKEIESPKKTQTEIKLKMKDGLSNEHFRGSFNRDMEERLMP